MKLFDNPLEIAKKLNLDLKSRPSELSCETYYKITEIYENAKRN